MANPTPTGAAGRTALAAARRQLLEAVKPVDRTETIPVAAGDGRVLAEPVVAQRAVPHYPRAAMDGYAVRAADLERAGDGSPVTLALRDGDVDPGTAAPIQTGEELPPGADTVVRVERTAPADDGVAVSAAVPEGKDVAPVGEDVAAGQRLYEPGHRLRPSDLGLAKSVGRGTLEVYARPAVSVLPTGSELVQGEPGPGEVVETNGLTVARYVERWGGRAGYRDVVEDDLAALESAVADELSADLVVTTGGSSMGERDLLPDVLDAMGELRVHGVDLKPGHPVGFGVVEGTPVLALPGYPVSAIVTAVQLLRPALKRAGRLPDAPHPTTRARLAEDVEGETGVDAFVRVRLETDGNAPHGGTGGEEFETGDDGGTGPTEGSVEGPLAVPVRSAGAGVLSSVGLADGWVTVPASRAGLEAGETVEVEDWEPSL